MGMELAIRTAGRFQALESARLCAPEYFFHARPEEAVESRDRCRLRRPLEAELKDLAVALDPNRLGIGARCPDQEGDGRKSVKEPHGHDGNATLCG